MEEKPDCHGCVPLCLLIAKIRNLVTFPANFILKLIYNCTFLKFYCLCFGRFRYKISVVLPQLEFSFKDQPSSPNPPSPIGIAEFDCAVARRGSMQIGIHMPRFPS